MLQQIHKIVKKTSFDIDFTSRGQGYKDKSQEKQNR